jgi:hypothetical protein
VSKKTGRAGKCGPPYRRIVSLVEGFADAKTASRQFKVKGDEKCQPQAMF